MEKIRKSTDGDIIDLVPGSREVVAAISADTVDRDGEVVVPSGMRRRGHSGMTVFYNHDTKLPIGSCQWVKASAGRLLAKHRFTDRTELGRDMFALVQDGVLRSYSIGFLPMSAGTAPTDAELREHPGWKGARRVFRDFDLLEYSLVGVPANPDAVQIAVAKGMVSQQTGDLLCRSKDPGPGDAADSHHELILHAEALAELNKLVDHGMVDPRSPWSWTPEEAHRELARCGGDWAKFSLNFLGRRDGSNPGSFGGWAYPVTRRGLVSVSGLHAAISRAAQSHESDIEAAARGLLAKIKPDKPDKSAPRADARLAICRGVIDRLCRPA